VPFFDKVHPSYSVISVGPDSYGHPSATVIGALAAFGKVYRTDRSGDITFNETADSLQVTSSIIPPPPPPNPTPASDTFVGSVNSKVYHYQSCRYAQRIKPENLITFTSAQDAKNHGSHPCKVCKPP